MESFYYYRRRRSSNVISSIKLETQIENQMRILELEETFFVISLARLSLSNQESWLWA